MPAPDSRKGAALVLFTLMIVLVALPMVGFAIDGAILFLIRTKLSAATDAAAAAGVRALSAGLDVQTQSSNARTVALRYFNANFPAGMLQTANSVLTTTIVQSSAKTRTVTASATVTAPVYFMKILGRSSANVSASSDATRRDVNLLLVLNRSTSMNASGLCGTVAAAAHNFVTRFANNRDRLGLITFTGSSSLDYAPVPDFLSRGPALPAVIDGLRCGGYSGAAQALTQAGQQIVQLNDPDALNAIVFVTDSGPNGVTALFPRKTQGDTRYDSSGSGMLVYTPSSLCAAPGPFTGVIAFSAGKTLGVFNALATSISDVSPRAVAAQGCAFSSDPSKVRQDVAFLPAVDAYGNATTGYKPVDTFSAGSYAGRMRVDESAAIAAASANAADNAARKIRNDRYRTVVFTIGLGGTQPDTPLDQDFLKRIATQNAASYAYAPTSTALSGAFESTAESILRLAK